MYFKDFCLYSLKRKWKRFLQLAKSLSGNIVQKPPHRTNKVYHKIIWLPLFCNLSISSGARPVYNNNVTYLKHPKCTIGMQMNDWVLNTEKYVNSETLTIMLQCSLWVSRFLNVYCVPLRSMWRMLHNDIYHNTDRRITT